MTCYISLTFKVQRSTHVTSLYNSRWTLTCTGMYCTQELKLNISVIVKAPRQDSQHIHDTARTSTTTGRGEPKKDNRIGQMGHNSRKIMQGQGQQPGQSGQSMIAGTR
jgi:hypothetical protein